MAKLAVLVLGLAGLIGSAHAEISTELFYRTGTPGSLDDVCLGYVIGVAAGLQYAKAAQANGQDYCLPPDVSYTQALLISRKFIEQHPELMSTPLGTDVTGMISLALVRAFPCRR